MHPLQKKISLFKQQGYKVYLHNIDIPGDESYRRAFVRYLETGRLINHAYLLDVADKPNLVYKQVKESNLADGYKKIDNYVKEGQQPILIENQGGISLGEKSSKQTRTKIQGTPTRETDQKGLEGLANINETFARMEAEAAAATPITREVQERLDLVDQINTKKAETEELILELRELQKTPFRTGFGKRGKRFDFFK